MLHFWYERGVIQLQRKNAQNTPTSVWQRTYTILLHALYLKKSFSEGINTLFISILSHVYRWRKMCVDTSRSFPHSWLITGFVTTVTLWVPLVKQELLILLEHLSSPSSFTGVRVARSLFFCVVFCRSLFILVLLAMVLSVLWFTDSEYSFVIFKLFMILIIIFWF